MFNCLLRTGRMVVRIAGIGLVFVTLSGCPETGLPSNGLSGDEPPPNTPAVPLPTYPGESLPSTSETLVYQEADIGDFEPLLDHVPPAVVDDYPGAVSVTYDPHPQRRLMVDDGVIVDPVSISLRVESAASIIHPDDYGPPLAECPTVQWVRYWKKLVSVTVPHPTNYQQSHTYTEGTSETTGESFAISLGLSAGAWGVGLSSELTYTFSREVTISSQESVTKTFTCDSRPDTVIQFTVWQLVDEYRICNGDGSLFTDPQYDFSSALAVQSETEQLYMSVVEFPE